MERLDKSDAYLQGVLGEEGKAMLKAFEDAQSEVSDIGITAVSYTHLIHRISR